MTSTNYFLTFAQFFNDVSALGKFTAYKLSLKTLPVGSSTAVEYRLDNEFFANIDGPEVQRGKVDVALTVKRTATVIELNFDLCGSIFIPCDRCLDDMELEIDTQEQLFIKLGHEYNEESDNMITIPEDEGEINVAWFLYEYIALSIPIKHVHPHGQCNKEMSKRLQQMSAHHIDEEDETYDLNDDTSAQDEEAPTDPRWDALKKLKR